MRGIVLICFLGVVSFYKAFAQKECASQTYNHQQSISNPALSKRIQEAESFIKKHLYYSEPVMSPAGVTGSGLSVIEIPVIVHVLYNSPEQKISEEQVRSQIDVLNEDFRKLNGMANIPDYFKSTAADCFIEFTLATIDPEGKATKGIVWKKTNESYFTSDDRIKYSRSGGDDAWDADRYLNIWVGKLSAGMVGYSSAPGCLKEKDGIVLRYTAFGTSGTATAPYHLGRTAVHEAGHWLGLKHIWGDRHCGDDEVSDTPPQKGPTKGCPLTAVASCDNTASGSMYMNYMDLTHDACTGMFTLGQRDRMRALFVPGGPRHALLSSQNNANASLPLPVELPIDAAPVNPVNIYPNPATNMITVNTNNVNNLKSDFITIHNHLGKLMMQENITSQTMHLNVSNLQQGLYYIKIGAHSKAYKFIKAGF
jgi:hypothetical protein